MFCDLHNHTVASDGEFTAEGIVKAAKAMGIRVLGVTDHDTIDSVRATRRCGQAEGVTVVPGVEATVQFRLDYFVGTLHVLLYFPPELLEDDSFVTDLNSVLECSRGEKLDSQRIAALSSAFPDLLGENPLTPEELHALPGRVTRAHFCKALIRRGIPELQAREMVANDSPAYVPSGIPLADIAPLVEKYPQIVPVLAHPAAGSGSGLYAEVLPPAEIVERVLPSLVEQIRLAGLEVYYPGHAEWMKEMVLSWIPKYFPKPEEVLTTGGSDCHNISEGRLLGTGGCERVYGEQLLKRLKML